MNNRYLYAALALALAFPFQSTPSSAAEATSEAATWLRIPTDVRSAAMGGDSPVLLDGAESISNNPAGLALQQHFDVSLSHSFWVQDLSLEHGTFGTGLGRDLGVGLSADYLNYGAINQFNVNSSGVVTTNGSITPQSMALAAGGGLGIGAGFYAGAAAKWIGENLDATGWQSTVALNAGALYKSSWGLSVGASLENMGPELQGYALPFKASLGAAYNLLLDDRTEGGGRENHSFTFAMCGNYLPNTEVSSFSGGFEYVFNRTLAARIGYKAAPYGDTNEIQGLTFGAGLSIEGFNLSYAMTTLGSLGQSNQVALSMMF